MSSDQSMSDQPRKQHYQAIERALKRKESIKSLQDSCTSIRDSLSCVDIRSSSNLQQKWCKLLKDHGSAQECLRLVEATSLQSYKTPLCKRDQLSAELELIRSWRQQRQDAASTIVRAARDWLGRRKAQQQVFSSHLQWLKMRRIFGSWRQQLAQQQQVDRELQAMQATFAHAVVTPWQAGARGFDAHILYQEGGPYCVAAAYHDWRKKGLVLLAWAQHVLGCRSKRTCSPC